ncbi:MAG: DEAD/DEAH box helicase family protein [Clostridia bacterium]|nr:DEAD/DEAH box helicase family protein [Clostridia bacterium]MBR4577767.1 DEAD/DEAH box helicase family protein [Clostridia bacterium]
MKFRFKIQQFQTDAVNSVVRVFEGQPKVSDTSYRRDIGEQPKILQPSEKQLSFLPSDQINFDDDVVDETGFLNERIHLSENDLLKNIQTIQTENNIRLSDSLIKTHGRCNLDVEMETGTGKTYVYIKTMFELNKRYGWSKFIVVVPSVAIREGVKKSFEITADHFMEQYGKKARFFIYSSDNLNQLDSFSSDSGINVMIINVQNFAASLKEDGRSKESRIIYSKRDEFGSRRPIDVIAANNPIIIMDEPQKMGGDVTQKALAMFKPLFILNYSATHAKQHNLVYVLDALDAYNKKLVKRIEVKGFEVKNLQGTHGYMYLEAFILSPNHPPMVRMEIEARQVGGSIKRKLFKLGVGDDLYRTSDEMEQYKNNYTIADIDPVNAKVTFANGIVIHKGDVIGDVSESDMRRVQIRETIISHMQKEALNYNRGIKTLSLFFIDEVAKYRQYDDEGLEVNGEYGRVFEEEYMSILAEYRNILDPVYLAYLDKISAHDTHRGYFSIDKKTGRAVNSELKRGSEFSDDISAYDLILKNKERLLSFDEPTRFIFSHSALREGWDNPNVFQICTLKHGGDSSTQKRQEVGRGLRLCVNQSGDRMDSDMVGSKVQVLNTLTVIASEGYASFVDDLQKQTKEVLYDRPRTASIDYFEGKNIFTEQGEQVKISSEQARAIYKYLIKNDYVDDKDHITQEYRDAVENNTLAAMPDSLQPVAEGVHKLVQAVYDDKMLAAMFADGNKKTPAPDNPLNDRFYKEAFQTLWKAINHKYAYTVDFDSEELIRKAVTAIDNELFVSRLQYTVTTGSQRDNISGNQMRDNEAFGNVTTKTSTLKRGAGSQVKYDLIEKIASGSLLTRRSAAAILQGISQNKFDMFKLNPEEFIGKVVRLINEQKATMIVDHITYDKIEGEYDSSIFTAEKNGRTVDQAFKAQKAIQDYVYTDGNAEKSVERKFAEEMDAAQEVYIYAKLPRGFAIPTPVGHYSPDWAIVFHEGTVKHVYFVAETKGTMESLELRPIEKAKIDCAKKLFNRLSNGVVTYDHVDSFQQLLNKVM